MSGPLMSQRPLAANRRPLAFAGDAPNGTEGDAYFYAYFLTGGRGPYNVTVLAGALPPGISVSPVVGEGGSPVLDGVLPQVP